MNQHPNHLFEPKIFATRKPTKERTKKSLSKLPQYFWDKIANGERNINTEILKGYLQVCEVNISISILDKVLF